jgi:hypothetical protein
LKAVVLIAQGGLAGLRYQGLQVVGAQLSHQGLRRSLLSTKLAGNFRTWPACSTTSWWPWPCRF